MYKFSCKDKILIKITLVNPTHLQYTKSEELWERDQDQFVDVMYIIIIVILDIDQKKF